MVVAGHTRPLAGASMSGFIDRPAHGKSAWTGKPAGVIGVSVGAIGTALAQQHLRNVLACLDVPVLGQPEAFLHAKDGMFDQLGDIDEPTGRFLQGWMDRYVAWVRRFAP